MTTPMPMGEKTEKWMSLYSTGTDRNGRSNDRIRSREIRCPLSITCLLLFFLIRAIGLILLGFGVVQVGLSLKSHDPSQRANGFLTLAGGVITFAKEILDLIMA